jgi:hypothetical protein
MKDDIEKLFKDHPSGGTKEDVFEQIIRFTLSPQYPWMKELVENILKRG